MNNVHFTLCTLKTEQFILVCWYGVYCMLVYYIVYTGLHTDDSPGQVSLHLAALASSKEGGGEVEQLTNQVSWSAWYTKWRQSQI